MSIDENRVVVARYPNGGIGDHLSCLIGSWFYAKRTGRTLVVDWRGSRYNPDPTGTSNCFARFFDVPASIAGVPVICGDEVDNWVYEVPIFPEKWTPATLAATAHLKHTQSEIDTINALVTSDQDRPEPTVVFNQWIHPSPSKAVVRELLAALPIAADIRRTADQIWQENLGDCPGIAIHIRHGNGENIGFRAAYWLSPWALVRQLKLNASVDMHRDGVHGRFADNMPDSLIPAEYLESSQQGFLKTVADRVQRMKNIAQLPQARPVLFCDAPVVVDGLRALLPDLVVPPKAFLEAGSGPLHAVSRDGSAIGPVAERITFDMMLELELMRRCSALICMDSSFSLISRMELDDDRIDFLRPTLLNRLVLKSMQWAI